MSPVPPKEPVHNRIRDLRQAAGLSQLQLAYRVGVTRQTINATEQEKCVPTLELAFRLALRSRRGRKRCRRIAGRRDPA